MAIYSERWPTGYALNTVTELELTTSQNIANNYTTVKYVVRVKKVNNYNDNWTPATGGSYTTLVIGGTSVLSGYRSTWTTSGGTGGYQTAIVASGSHNVYHNADGTREIDYKLTLNPNVSGISNMPDRMIEGSFTATTIPRASTFTLADTLTTGTSYTLTITRASTAFTHKVVRVIGGEEVAINNSATTSATVNMPHSIFNSYPSSSSVTATIIVRTFNGSTQIGSTSKAVTVNLVSSAIPTVGSVGYSNSNSGPMGVTQLMRGLSMLTLSASTVSGSYSSTVVGYEFRYKRASGTYEGTISTSSSSHQYQPFNFPSSGNETLAIATRVRDSRGRYSAWVETASAIRVHFYQSPSIGSMTVRRVGAAETTLQVTRSYTVIGLYSGGGTTNSNSASLSFQTRPLNGATSNNTGAQSTTLTLSNSAANLSGTFSASTSYEVRAVLSDSISTVYGSWMSVGTQFAPIDIGPKGVGIGKIHSDGAYDLEVGSGGINSEGAITATRYNNGTNHITGNGSYTRIQSAHGNIELGPANTSYAHIYTDRPQFYFNKELLMLGHKIWNANNDGSGSGLDADLLDGKHASSFVDLSNVDLLQDNVNLNTLMTPGIYQRSSDAAVAGMANTPDNNSGYLEVFGTGTMVYQRWTSYAGGNVYVRRYYNGWSSWTNINGGVTTGGSGFDRWVRFSSGETIAWGRHSSSASAANFNFSKTFSAAPLVTVNASMADFNPGFNLTGISTSSFSVSVVDARNGGLWNKGTYMLHYQAMGMS